MSPGEYAVHYSSFVRSAPEIGPSCTILGSLAEAEEYAKAQVALKPGLRCRIYDHQGFVGPPILEVRGQQYVGEREMSPRFRKWLGSVLFFGGLALIILDWNVDFRLTWPATIGVRMLIPGLILLLTEVILVLHAKRSLKAWTSWQRAPARITPSVSRSTSLVRCCTAALTSSQRAVAAYRAKASISLPILSNFP